MQRWLVQTLLAYVQWLFVEIALTLAVPVASHAPPIAQDLTHVREAWFLRLCLLADGSRQRQLKSQQEVFALPLVVIPDLTHFQLTRLANATVR